MLTARDRGISANGGKVFSLAVMSNPPEVLLVELGGGFAKSKMNDFIPPSAMIFVLSAAVIALRSRRMRYVISLRVSFEWGSKEIETAAIGKRRVNRMLISILSLFK